MTLIESVTESAKFDKTFLNQMKQLDVVVSPPAFLQNPYLTLISVTYDPDHVTFDLDICDL